ncbi:hypothetical protein ACIBI8_40430 [Streptomyces sp. NPDC050529]|uniref:DUF7739 domain-containing protein n=1 Tax=Streptomyces sp. NPDC050529 TaxID=3365624 RepID=UPI003789BAE3
MSTHIVTSHGADFFGEDRYEIRDLKSLSDYADGCLPVLERGALVRFLAHTGDGDQDLPADQAAEFAGLLRQVATHRFTRPKPAAHAALLAAAAARAAADGESWTWTVTAS